MINFKTWQGSKLMLAIKDVHEKHAGMHEKHEN